MNNLANKGGPFVKVVMMTTLAMEFGFLGRKKKEKTKNEKWKNEKNQNVREKLSETGDMAKFINWK